MSEIVGEKEFFEFMKRANRDLNGSQRHTLMMYALDALKINKEPEE